MIPMSCGSRPAEVPEGRSRTRSSVARRQASGSQAAGKRGLRRPGQGQELDQCRARAGRADRPGRRLHERVRGTFEHDQKGDAEKPRSHGPAGGEGGGIEQSIWPLKERQDDEEKAVVGVGSVFLWRISVHSSIVTISPRNRLLRGGKASQPVAAQAMPGVRRPRRRPAP